MFDLPDCQVFWGDCWILISSSSHLVAPVPPTAVTTMPSVFSSTLCEGSSHRMRQNPETSPPVTCTFALLAALLGGCCSLSLYSTQWCSLTARVPLSWLQGCVDERVARMSPPRGIHHCVPARKTVPGCLRRLVHSICWINGRMKGVTGELFTCLTEVQLHCFPLSHTQWCWLPS